MQTFKSRTLKTSIYNPSFCLQPLRSEIVATGRGITESSKSNNVWPVLLYANHYSTITYRKLGKHLKNIFCLCSLKKYTLME